MINTNFKIALALNLYASMLPQFNGGLFSDLYASEFSLAYDIANNYGESEDQVNAIMTAIVDKFNPSCFLSNL